MTAVRHLPDVGTPALRDALEGKGPQRRPQKRSDRRLGEVAEAVWGGYCRLQMPFNRALGVRETLAGHRLGALERGGGGQCIPCPPPPPPPHTRDPCSSRPPTRCRTGRPNISPGFTRGTRPLCVRWGVSVRPDRRAPAPALFHCGLPHIRVWLSPVCRACSSPRRTQVCVARVPARCECARACPAHARHSQCCPSGNWQDLALGGNVTHDVAHRIVAKFCGEKSNPRAEHTTYAHALRVEDASSRACVWVYERGKCNGSLVLGCLSTGAVGEGLQ